MTTSPTPPRTCRALPAVRRPVRRRGEHELRVADLIEHVLTAAGISSACRACSSAVRWSPVPDGPARATDRGRRVPRRADLERDRERASDARPPARACRAGTQPAEVVQQTPDVEVRPAPRTGSSPARRTYARAQCPPRSASTEAWKYIWPSGRSAASRRRASARSTSRVRPRSHAAPAAAGAPGERGEASLSHGNPERSARRAAIEQADRRRMLREVAAGTEAIKHLGPVDIGERAVLDDRRGLGSAPLPP